jgi:uncharacterized membrane protein YtjA (UPF0391 family)
MQDGFEAPPVLGAVQINRAYALNYFRPEMSNHHKKEHTMLRLALFFLIVALIAGALGVSGVAAVSSEIAWILFAVFIVLFLVSLVMGMGRRTGPPI